jgi:hypothetical protein
MKTARQKTAGPPQRIALGLRVSAELKEKIDSAAAASGLSQSQEAERRLINSFRDQEIIERTMALAYGDRFAGVILTLASALKDLGAQAQFQATAQLGDWADNAFAYDQVVTAINRILEAMRPPGDPTETLKWNKGQSIGEPPTAALRAAAANPGHSWANGALLAIAGVPQGGSMFESLGRLRPLLGDAIVNRVRQHLAANFFKTREQK